MFTFIIGKVRRNIKNFIPLIISQKEYRNKVLFHFGQTHSVHLTENELCVGDLLVTEVTET